MKFKKIFAFKEFFRVIEKNFPIPPESLSKVIFWIFTNFVGRSLVIHPGSSPSYLLLLRIDWKIGDRILEFRIVEKGSNGSVDVILTFTLYFHIVEEPPEHFVLEPGTAVLSDFCGLGLDSAAIIKAITAHALINSDVSCIAVKRRAEGVTNDSKPLNLMLPERTNFLTYQIKNVWTH